MKLLYILSALFILISCAKDESTEIVGTDGIFNNLKTTNIDWVDSQSVNISGQLKAWDYINDGLIPVKTNDVAIAIQAMDQIEQQLGLVIFDRTLISNTPDNEISRGLIISEGTSLGPGGVVNSHSCGSVSDAIGSTNSYPPNYYDADMKLNARLYINLSSSGCNADVNIAIHEFGHALGMAVHFKGFGIGDSIDNNFWNVLYNIYHNNIGSDELNITITQVAF